MTNFPKVGELTVWSQGARAINTPISPKKLRKFARALLALANQVDPQTPRVEYFETPCGFLYRQRAGKHLEIWSDSTWTQSAYPTIVAQQKDNDSWPITVEELPLAARPA